MHYHSVIGYFIFALFAVTIFMAQANKEREQFADLLQKRKHLTGYWVGKRLAIASDENLFDSDEDLSEAKRTSYLVGKRGTYLVGKRASYLVGRKRRDLQATDSNDQ